MRCTEVVVLGLSSALFLSNLICVTESQLQCKARLLRRGGLNQTDKTQIVEKHNLKRQLLAMGKVPHYPGAMNMLEMRRKRKSTDGGRRHFSGINCEGWEDCWPVASSYRYHSQQVSDMLTDGSSRIAVRCAPLLILVVMSGLLTKCDALCTGAKLLRSGGLTCEDKELILRMHNRLRALVAVGNVTSQSAAVNMLQLSWDETLAQEAQSWAEGCIVAHSPDRHVEGLEYGQNVGVTWSTPVPNELGDKPAFEDAIQSWFDEVHYGSVTGHYTQIVWSTTYLIGCGYAYYLRGSDYTKLYICNYAPAGNVEGHIPYARGRPSCTEFGTTPSSEYKGLCKIKASHSTHGEDSDSH